MFQSHFNLAQQLIILSSAVSILFAIVCYIKQKYSLGVFFIITGGLLLRLMMAGADPFLFLWDEQFHALVAKNMMKNPLKPMLYTNPVLSYDFTRWDQNHIWLHKQPLFLWQIALSYKLFGINEFALRLPSAVMSALVIFFIYRIGKNLLNEKIGWLGAFLFALSNFQLEIVTGNTHTDHNDVAFMFYVTATIWAFSEYLQSKSLKWVIAIGVLAGIAVLVKWLVGLLVLLIWGLLLLFDKENRKKKSSYKHIIIASITAAIVFLPWQVYTLIYFPAEASFELSYNGKHFFNDIEGHKGDAWFHFDQLAIQFGKLAPYIVLIALYCVYKNKKSSEKIFLIIGSIAIIYLFYTLAATKMPLFCNVVAPLLYLTFGALLFEIINIINRIQKNKVAKPITIAMLFVVGFFNLDIHAIETKHTLLNTDHFTTSRIHNTVMNKRIHEFVPSDDYVIFNCNGYNTTLVMFYTGHTAYGFYPNESEYVSLKEKKIKMAVFVSDDMPDFIKKDTDIIKIPLQLQNF